MTKLQSQLLLQGRLKDFFNGLETLNECAASTEHAFTIQLVVTAQVRQPADSPSIESRERAGREGEGARERRKRERRGRETEAHRQVTAHAWWLTDFLDCSTLLLAVAVVVIVTVLRLFVRSFVVRH